LLTVSPEPVMPALTSLTGNGAGQSDAATAAVAETAGAVTETATVNAAIAPIVARSFMESSMAIGAMDNNEPRG
jgi:hypothetical protein